MGAPELAMRVCPAVLLPLSTFVLARKNRT